MKKAVLAAINNAQWCNLMCGLHGAPGKFTSTFWMSAGEVPPLYSNFVTTEPGHNDRHLSEIANLVQAAPNRAIAVKDSFSCLDLGELGFSVHFSGEWYVRAPAPSPTSGELDGWHQIATGKDLQEWEKAWRAEGGLTELGPSPFFPNALMKCDGVFIMGYREGRRLVAGAVAYKVENAVGLTNFFSPDREKLQLFTSCLAFVAQRQPDKSIVGYEDPEFTKTLAPSSADLTGPLRVWIRPETPAGG